MYACNICREDNLQTSKDINNIYNSQLESQHQMDVLDVIENRHKVRGNASCESS